MVRPDVFTTNKNVPPVPVSTQVFRVEAGYSPAPAQKYDGRRSSNTTDEVLALLRECLAFWVKGLVRRISFEVEYEYPCRRSVNVLRSYIGD